MKVEFVEGQSDNYILVTETYYDEEFGLSERKEVYELDNSGLTEFIRYVTNNIYNKYSEEQNNIFVLFGKGNKCDGKVIDEYWEQCDKKMKLENFF